MEKSQHTDFNKDTTNESASVACSNIRLWKLDTQKEWRSLDAFEMKGLRKTLRVSWTAKKPNEWVLNKAGVKRELLDCQSKEASLSAQQQMWPRHSGAALLHWLPVQRWVEFKIAYFVHQLLASFTSRPTWLLTFISSPSLVAASCARLLIGH